MRSAFYFLYLTIALVSADCNPPPNTAGLTLETGVVMDDIAKNMEPAYPCECDVGVRYFWHSSNTPVPYDAEKWINIQTGAYNDCKNIRSEEGTCYLFGQYLNSYIFNIHITLSITGSIVSCMQSMNRTVALYLPILYAHRFKNKHMLFASLISFSLIFFICLPILFLEVNRTAIYEIDSEFIVPNELGLLYIYFLIYIYTDYAMLLISFLFDSATAFKLARFFKNQPDGWTRHKLLSELIILVQNFMNIVFFLMSMIPYLLYVTICKYDIPCYDTVFHRLIIILYRYNSNRVIWRTCDELFTLMVQFRIYRRERKELKTSTTSMTQKLSVLEKMKRKIKGTSAAPIMK